MATTPGAGGTPGDGETPPQPNGQSQTDPHVAEPTSQADGGMPAEDVTGLKSALESERKAKKALESRLKKLEEADREREEQGKSDLEKAQTRIAELERAQSDSARAQQERETRYAVMAAASRLGFADPEDAYGLLDLAEVEYDEDGRPTNVQPLLEQLLQRKAYLRSAAARPSGSIDIGAPGPGAPTLDQRIREAEDRNDWKTSRALKSQKLAQQMSGSATR